MLLPQIWTVTDPWNPVTPSTATEVHQAVDLDGLRGSRSQAILGGFGDLIGYVKTWLRGPLVIVE